MTTKAYNDRCRYCGAIHRYAADECHPEISRMFELLEDAEDKKLILSRHIATLEATSAHMADKLTRIMMLPHSDEIRSICLEQIPSQKTTKDNS